MYGNELHCTTCEGNGFGYCSSPLTLAVSHCAPFCVSLHRAFTPLSIYWPHTLVFIIIGMSHAKQNNFHTIFVNSQDDTNKHRTRTSKKCTTKNSCNANGLIATLMKWMKMGYIVTAAFHTHTISPHSIYGVDFSTLFDSELYVCLRPKNCGGNGNLIWLLGFICAFLIVIIAIDFHYDYYCLSNFNRYQANNKTKTRCLLCASGHFYHSKFE